MNKQRCQYPNCQAQAVRVLRDNHNIYCYFCQEHFEVCRKALYWTFNWEEDNRIAPLLRMAKWTALTVPLRCTKLALSGLVAKKSSGGDVISVVELQYIQHKLLLIRYRRFNPRPPATRAILFLCVWMRLQPPFAIWTHYPLLQRRFLYWLLPFN